MINNRYRPYKNCKEFEFDFRNRFGTYTAVYDGTFLKKQPWTFIPVISKVDSKTIFRICSFTDFKENGTRVHVGNSVITFTDLLNQFTYSDGTTCGVLTNEVSNEKKSRL